MTMIFDFLLEKAREFTLIEDATLDGWLRAFNAQNFRLAARIVNSGLLAEHYRSLLDADPANITPQQSSTYSDLKQTFQATLDELAAFDTSYNAPLVGDHHVPYEPAGGGVYGGATTEPTPQ